MYIFMHYIHTYIVILCVHVFHLFSIKIHDLSELKEVYTIVDIEEEKGMLLHE